MRPRGSLRRRWLHAGLLAGGGLVLFVAAVAAFAQPDDGTDGAGMLGLSLLALAGSLLVVALVVLLQDRLGRILGLAPPSGASAPAGWYRVESRGGALMWWDGQAWSDPPADQQGAAHTS